MWQNINKKLEKLKLRNKKITYYVKSTCTKRSQPQNTKFNSKSKSLRFLNDISKPKTYKNPSQVETVNEIKEKLHDETENDTTDTNSSDVDLSSQDSDFQLCKNIPQEMTQIHLDDKMTADFQVSIHNRKISTLWDTGASKSVISENTYKRYIGQIKYIPALALHFPLPVAATSAQ